MILMQLLLEYVYIIYPFISSLFPSVYTLLMNLFCTFKVLSYCILYFLNCGSLYNIV